MENETVSAREDASAGGSANGAVFGPGHWSDGFKGCRAAVYLTVKWTLKDTCVGRVVDELERLSQQELVEIRTAAGGERRSLAHALHDAGAKPGSLLFGIDGRQLKSHAAIPCVVRAFSELSRSAQAEENRDAIVHSTVFLNNTHFLDNTALAYFQSLAEQKKAGAIVPRLIVGCIREQGLRLEGFTVLDIPALRDRPGDIEKIVERRFQGLQHRPALTANAMKVLQGWDWPNDEEELNRFLDRAFLQYAGSTISAELARTILDPSAQHDRPDLTLAIVEEEHIYRVLEREGWNRTRTAKVLGIDVKTLYNKLRRYEARRQSGGDHNN